MKVVLHTFIEAMIADAEAVAQGSGEYASYEDAFGAEGVKRRKYGYS